MKRILLSLGLIASLLFTFACERKGGPGAFHVNLIAYNPTGSEYVAADDASVRRFRGELERGGLGTSYRVSRGRGIEAACGQLVMQGIPARERAS